MLSAWPRGEKLEAWDAVLLGFSTRLVLQRMSPSQEHLNGVGDEGGAGKRAGFYLKKKKATSSPVAFLVAL